MHRDGWTGLGDLETTASILSRLRVTSRPKGSLSDVSRTGCKFLFRFANWSSNSESLKSATPFPRPNTVGLHPNLVDGILKTRNPMQRVFKGSTEERWKRQSSETWGVSSLCRQFVPWGEPLSRTDRSPCRRRTPPSPPPSSPQGRPQRHRRRRQRQRGRHHQHHQRERRRAWSYPQRSTR